MVQPAHVKGPVYANVCQGERLNALPGAGGEENFKHARGHAGEGGHSNLSGLVVARVPRDGEGGDLVARKRLDARAQLLLRLVGQTRRHHDNAEGWLDQGAAARCNLGGWAFKALEKPVGEHDSAAP